MARLSIAAILGFAFALGAFPAQGETGRGRIKFEELRHDFGQVKRGEKPSYTFRFKNDGKGPLTIQGVHAGCGCTAVEVDAGKVYRPGEEGKITVTLDTRDFVGHVTKAVTVMTNEKVLPDRTLTVKAFVVSEIEAQPPLVDFAEVAHAESPAREVQVKPLDGFDLRILGVTYNEQALKVERRREGKGEVLTVTLLPAAQPGFLKETILVKTSSRNLPELTIPVRATIKGAIEFTPSYLEFGAVSAGDKSRRSITLKAKKDFDIKGTKTELIINGQRVGDADRYVRIETVRHEKERTLVSVELTNVAKTVGSVHGRLLFETSDPAQKELAVDFYAFFR